MMQFQIFPEQVNAGILEDSKNATDFDMHFMHQVHGADVLELLEATEGSVCHIGGHDALVTKVPGIKLVVKTADCIPVLFADIEAGVVAAAHAGWRSLVAGILPKTVAAMAELGAEPGQIKVGIGPSLGPCCSEFSNPYEEIPAQYHWAIKKREDGRFFVHLNNIALVQLQEAGIYHRNLERMRICTQCSSDLPSWRRDKTEQRMASFIGLA